MEKCVLTKTLNLIGKKWTLLVLFELYKGEDNWKRFNYLKKRLKGITPKMISARLKELESFGLIKKRINKKFSPIGMEYCLANRGKSFIKVIFEIKEWVLEKNSKKDCCNRDCRYCFN